MSTIDGNEIKNVTIDGVEVSSITMDGITVWQKLVDAGVLRNIEVGDDLSGKTLYIGFSDNFYTMLDNYGGMGNVIETVDNELDITSDVDSGIYEVDCYDTTQFTNLYYYDNGNLTDNISLYTVETSSNKIVTNINKSHPAYKYIKIIDDGLRNIEVGDNLSNKQLYLSFPNDLYLNLNSYGSSDYIFNTGYNYIYNSTSGGIQRMQINEDSGNPLYHWNGTSVATNLSNVILQSDFGIVSDITPNHPAYPYVKIRKAPYYKNIEVGDNLSSANLYMAFPDDAYDFISIDSIFVLCDNGLGSDIHYSFDDEYGDAEVIVWEDDIEDQYRLYANYDNINLKEYRLSQNFGVVTSINSSIPAYKYIFVKIRPIEVDDLLSNRSVYCNFPDDIHQSFDGSEGDFIRSITTEQNPKGSIGTSGYDNNKFIQINIPGASSPIIYHYDGATVLTNETSLYTGGIYGIPFGIVGEVDTVNPLYQFVGMIDQPKLRHIKVGDNLSGKTLYFNFPNDLAIQYSSNLDIFLTIGSSDDMLFFTATNFEQTNYCNVKYVRIDGYTDIFVGNGPTSTINLPSITLTSGFGIVNSIDTTPVGLDLLNYIWVLDN